MTSFIEILMFVEGEHNVFSVNVTNGDKNSQ